MRSNEILIPNLLSLRIKPRDSRVRMHRINSPKIERDRASAGELLELWIRILLCIKINHVTGSPRRNADHLVFTDLTIGHKASLTNRALD